MKKILKSGNSNIKDDPEKEKEALDLLSGHENIIKLIEYFEDEVSYNFLFEYCPSGSLETFMKRFETAPIELIKYYTA